MDDNFKSRIITFLNGLAIIFILICLGFFFCAYKSSSYVPEKNIIVKRTDDEGFSRLLTEEKIAPCYTIAKIFVKIARFRGYGAKFGEYALPRGVSLSEAVEIIDSGNVVIHKITIPEGFSSVQIIKRLEKNEDLTGEAGDAPPEGVVMPDTYHFKYPTSKQEIISMARKAMREFLQQEWPKRSPLCTLKNPWEALILASIVEKETNLEKEMVAGVYLHRLKIGMKLQACPTVIYAHKKGESLGHPLRYDELKINDPYNTYLYEGLPPAPISNPGRASILAVLHPEETDNLFFVFAGNGRHVFSKTFEEHKRNIAKIRNTAF
ncbi:MAG: endolytic transglycosylase MltG [Holosporaceae bacterium]|jgi:UPF0755 protein|nr:endolytic transglycosylase MltG [Holosporaceae bacterium]